MNRLENKQIDFNNQSKKAAGKANKKLQQTQYRCLFPGCSEIAISSHSQQRKKQLQSISENNHVYAVEKNLCQKTRRVIDEKEEKYFLKYKLISTKKASTFPGYCSKHDSKLFEPIEQNMLLMNDAKQGLLLCLRAHSFEYLQKKQVYVWQKAYLKEIQSFINLEEIKHRQLKIGGIQQYIEIDAPYYSSAIFEAINGKKDSAVDTIWTIIPKNIGISSSCCFSPFFYAHDNYMAENQNSIQPAVFFSVVPNKENTHIVLSWLSEHSRFANHLRQLTSNKEKLNKLIIQLCFGESEDTCISPKLWDSLSFEEQEQISSAIKFTRGYDLPAPLPTII